MVWRRYSTFLFIHFFVFVSLFRNFEFRRMVATLMTTTATTKTKINRLEMCLSIYANRMNMRIRCVRIPVSVALLCIVHFPIHTIIFFSSFIQFVAIFFARILFFQFFSFHIFFVLFCVHCIYIESMAHRVLYTFSIFWNIASVLFNVIVFFGCSLVVYMIFMLSCSNSLMFRPLLCRVLLRTRFLCSSQYNNHIQYFFYYWLCGYVVSLPVIVSMCVHRIQTCAFFVRIWVSSTSIHLCFLLLRVTFNIHRQNSHFKYEKSA